MTVKVTDKGLDDIFKFFGEGPSVIGVGFSEKAFGTKHPNADMTVGDLALIHEFGAGNVPQRSFIRSTFDENRQDMEKEIGTILQRGSLTAKRVLAGLRKVGRSFRKKVIDKMDKGIAGDPEGPVRFLEDTRTLKNAIEVVDKQ